jgi:phage gp37-like protein
MAELTLRNARTSIERGIVRALANAYKVRQPAAATVAALRLLTSASIPHDTYRVVTASGVAYRWDRYSASADNGTSIIKPLDLLATKPGRWLSTGSEVSSGYLKQVEAYNGQGAIEDVCERLLGQKPSVLVVWTGANHKLESWNHGALWYYDCDFDIWVFASNLRDGFETEEGSSVSAELSADPGVNAVLGDIKTILAGSTYDLESVAYTDLGKETRIAEDQASRTALERLSITVRATLHNPDTDLEELDDTFIVVQHQLAETPENLRAGIGPDDYVVSGCAIPTGGSLTQTPDAGSAYVGSSLVSVVQTAHTFGATKHTYRDLAADGTYSYTEVDYYQTPPDPEDGTLRVGVTVTDGSSVTFDRILADSLIDYGEPYNVPPP